MAIDERAAALRPRRVVESSILLSHAPSLVWHCLIDPVLADGWLAHVLVDEVVGGRYAVVWPDGEPHEADWFGEIAVLDPQRRLLVAFPPHTDVEFALVADEAPDASAARLTVRHAAFLTVTESRAVQAFWNSRLGDLAELLRGRPVVWNPGLRG